MEEVTITSEKLDELTDEIIAELFREDLGITDDNEDYNTADLFETMGTRVIRSLSIYLYVVRLKKKLFNEEENNNG